MDIFNCFGKLKLWMNKSGKEIAVEQFTELPIQMEEVVGDSCVTIGEPEVAENENHAFLYRRTEYKRVLEKWMQDEKPYRDKDFRLLDVMKVLPLNRSYLSRMFNEVYGESFFAFVMRYRIEESTRLLITRPDWTIAYIAQSCGFSSASVFGRAFLKNIGMTPKQYRMLHGESVEGA